jgi:cysteinyl-tRNA synthetase
MEKMAKSTGNNMPREILTGENTILSKAFSGSQWLDFSCYKHSIEYS